MARIILFISLHFLGVALAQEPDSTYIEPQTTDSQAESQATPNADDPRSPVTLNTTPAPAPTDPASHEHDGDAPQNAEAGGNGYQKFWNDSLAQWIMAFAAVLGVLVSIWAVCLLRRTLHETSKATMAVRASNRITRDAVDAQEKKAIAELRAYVGVRDMGIQPEQLTRLYRPTIVVQVENCGQTPARNLRIRSELFIADSLESISKSIFSGLALNIPVSGAELYKGGVVEHNLGHTLLEPWLTEEEESKFRSEGIRFYVAGRITYADIFDIPRYKNFCYRSTMIGDHIRFAACDTYNDSN